ncbi:MAG: AMMECR1 domain-containing protein, partial [Nitrosopumilus sp.]|nr:AMMECR1 domain-containing protein [Nitrosopumilus sp.]
YTSGLLLPQVPVEYNWDVEEFLKYTCEKAGLGKDAWKDKGIRVLKFEGVIFKEKSPNGLVIRESSDDFL